jgi:hypothetical protein
MARSRKSDDESASQDAESAGVARHAAASESADNQAATGGRLTESEGKLHRMQETNRICFRHQNDLARIEQELKTRFGYSDAELQHILEPKGQRMIPGYGYSEIERQKQYVGFLKRLAERDNDPTEGADQKQEPGGRAM